MPAGYSATPLAKKLGIKPGATVVALGAPKNYRELLEPLPVDVEFSDRIGDGESSFIHHFSTARGELEILFPRLRESLAKTGILWISWPKKSAKVETDLTRESVREIGLGHGLVDTKVCAVDEIWSGLKFMWRLKDR